MEEQQRKKEVCYLCGSANPDTRDHVVPKGLFDSPGPSNLITLPAHFSCNNPISKDEEFFRFFVLTGQDELPVAKKLWQEKVLLSSFQRSPKFKQMLKSKIRLTPVNTVGGLYLGEVPFFYAEQLRIDAVLRKIVKGLFYHHNEARLEGTIRILTHDIYNHENWVKIEDLLGGELGEGVFKYRFVPNKSNPHNSTWLLVFYNKHLFIIETKAENQMSNA